MEKKKYEAPVTEVVKVETECLLAALSALNAYDDPDETYDIVEGTGGGTIWRPGQATPTNDEGDNAPSYSPWK